MYITHKKTRNHNNDTRVVGQGLYKGLKCDFLIPRNENLQPEPRARKCAQKIKLLPSSVVTKHSPASVFRSVRYHCQLLKYFFFQRHLLIKQQYTMILIMVNCASHTVVLVLCRKSLAPLTVSLLSVKIMSSFLIGWRPNGLFRRKLICDKHSSRVQQQHKLPTEARRFFVAWT